MQERFADKLLEWERQGRRRMLSPIETGPPGYVRRDGRAFLDFSGNDYLGLSRHPLLAERAGKWAQEIGTGSRASRLVTGSLSAHHQIESRLASFKKTEAALLFASGWQANAAIFPALFAAAPKAVIFADRLVHSSIHHGIAAAQKRQIRFRHNDLSHLESLLQQHGAQADARFIVTESVFSMDGDRCDLRAMTQLAKAYDAFLIVDEAHATGVLGPGGAGLTAEPDVAADLVMGTFSKAMGSFGAYVAGSALLRDYLVNACSGFIYSTALPPQVLGAIDAALDIVPGMDRERGELAGKAGRIRSGLQAAGYDTLASDTQIVPVLVGEARDALALSERLADSGILAIAIRPPTVAQGSSRLRLALSSLHDDSAIDQLLAAIGGR